MYTVNETKLDANVSYEAHEPLAKGCDHIFNFSLIFFQKLHVDQRCSYIPKVRTRHVSYVLVTLKC